VAPPWRRAGGLQFVGAPSFFGFSPDAVFLTRERPIDQSFSFRPPPPLMKTTCVRIILFPKGHAPPSIFSPAHKLRPSRLGEKNPSLLLRVTSILRRKASPLFLFPPKRVDRGLRKALFAFFFFPLFPCFFLNHRAQDLFSS